MKDETCSYLWGMISMLVAIGIILVTTKNINFGTLFGCLMGTIILATILYFIEKERGE